MFLPRRRITPLVLASIIAIAIWYFDYLPNLFYSSTGPKNRPHLKTRPQTGNLPPDGISSNATVDTRPDSTSKSNKEGASQPPRFKGGSHTFGSRKFFEKFPVKDYIFFSKGLPLELAKLQHDFEKEDEGNKNKRLERLEAVKSSFEHSWQGYKKHAWMADELSPMDGKSAQSFGGWAATLVDTLDTLWIMGMKDDFDEAVNAVKDLDFNSTEEQTLNVFETTIRYLGGFLGAYDLTNGAYPVLLQKATEVGDLLYCAFDTPNRMPVTRWKWREALEGAKQTAGEATLIAEIGSLTLEFTRLSQLTGDLKYFDAVQRIMDEFDSMQSFTKLPGLWPVVMNAKNVTFEDTGFTLGGMADSLYEYMPKQHMLLGGRTEQMEKMYKYSITAAMNHIFFQPMVPDNKDILISGAATVGENSKDIKSEPRGQHLGCYTGGMVGIGAKLFDQPEQMNMARKLVDGCIWAYDHMPSGIMPEVFNMVACEMNADCLWDEKKWHQGVIEAAKNRQKGPDEPEFANDQELLNYTLALRHLTPGFTDIWDPRYLLRPEAIESVFIHYRLTGDSDLPEAAWRMFQAIEKHTKTEYGNAALMDVRMEKTNQFNKMESFWLAETLKYFYLIFSEPKVVSLDDYVL
ncbi:hypothetical protein MMC28_003205 [Mycoblastus sanguinarius]|nr:hypothetical protein [Mycoblastus sanguinarius]